MKLLVWYKKACLRSEADVCVINVYCLVDVVPGILKENKKKADEALKQSEKVTLLSENVQRNISNIRKLIEDTRRKAASVSNVRGN